jgi:hypothetical protein
MRVSAPSFAVDRRASSAWGELGRSNCSGSRPRSLPANLLTLLWRPAQAELVIQVC